MSSRRQAITVLLIFIICVATAWVWAWPSKADTGPVSSMDSTTSVSIVAQEPMCSVPVAGWLVQRVPCSSLKPMPAIVRKCAGSAIVGAILAYLSGGTSVLVGGGTGLMGCIPWAGNN